MGKIEDIFGSFAAAHVFLQNAIKQPILRLEISNSEIGQFRIQGYQDLQSIEIRAHAGFVTGTLLVEPPAENLPEPVIEIAPVSKAKVKLLSSELTTRINLQKITCDVEDSENMRIKNPLSPHENSRPHVTQLLNKQATLGRSALTLTGSHPIRVLLGELRNQTEAGSGVAAYTLEVARVALKGIWE